MIPLAPTIAAPDPERSPVAHKYFMHWPRPCPNLCGIEGFTGSGKTGTVFRKKLALAFAMPRSPIDGKRYYQDVALATTYRQLWRGPIPSFLKVLPRELGDWHGSPPDSPASFVGEFRLPDRSICHFEQHFVAIGEKFADDEELERIFRGWEPTTFHLIEMDTLPARALEYAIGRSGRYPEKKHGFPPWFGVFFDLNAPRQTSWVYDAMLHRWREGDQFFRQPPAVARDGMGGWVVNPRAENQENMPPGFLAGQLANNKIQYIRRYLAGEHMPDEHGKPIYGFWEDDAGKLHGCFDSTRHIAKKPIEPIPGVPLGFGTDGGTTPGGWFFQVIPGTQQVRVIQEILAEHGTREKRYAAMIRQALASPPFNGRWRLNDDDMLAGADPSCFFGKDEKSGEDDWIWALERELGGALHFRPGGGIGNKLLPRIEVIENLLRAPDAAPGQPKFLVSPICKFSIEALEGGYRYARLRIVSEQVQYDFKPEKNHLCNLIEGGQYGLLRVLGSDAAWGHYDRSSRPSGPRASITENNEDGSFYPPSPRGFGGQVRGARAQRSE